MTNTDANRARHAKGTTMPLSGLLAIGLVAGGHLLLSAPADAQVISYIEEAAQKAEACDKGGAEACYRRGQLAGGSYSGIRANPEEQQRYFARACSANHAAACNSEASYWQRGQKDLPRSRQLYGKACNLGHANSCGLYAKTLAWGLGGPVDYAGAQLAFDMQCARDVAKGEGADTAACKGDEIIAETRMRSNSRAQAAGPGSAQRQVRTASYPANQDSQCTANYNTILAIPQGLSDAEIKWSLAYEAAVRDGGNCPPNFPARGQIARRSTDTTITEDMYQPTPGRSGKANSDARSGYENCRKSNGASGQRYWYYGFDNKRIYGPCL